MKKIILFFLILTTTVISTGVQHCPNTNTLSEEAAENTLTQTVPGPITYQEELRQSLKDITKFIKGNGTGYKYKNGRPLERRSRLGYDKAVKEGKIRHNFYANKTLERNTLDLYTIIKPPYDGNNAYMQGLNYYYQNNSVRLCYSMPCSCPTGTTNMLVPLGSLAAASFKSCILSRLTEIQTNCAGSTDCNDAIVKATGMVNNCDYYTRGAIFWQTLSNDQNMLNIKSLNPPQFSMIYSYLFECSCEIIQSGYCGSNVSTTYAFQYWYYDYNGGLPVPNNLIQISIGFTNLVVAVTSSNLVYYKPDRTAIWYSITGVYLKYVNVAKLDNTICGITTTNLLACQTFGVTGWVTYNTGINLKTVVSDKMGSLWAVDTSNALWRSYPCATFFCGWVKFTSSLSFLDATINESGDLFVVDTSSRVYYKRVADSVFTLTDGSFVHVTTSGNTLCGIDSGTNLYCRLGSFGNGGWVRSLVELPYAEIGLDGRVIGIFGNQPTYSYFTG